jgi:hypothetical protein
MLCAAILKGVTTTMRHRKEQKALANAKRQWRDSIDQLHSQSLPALPQWAHSDSSSWSEHGQGSLSRQVPQPENMALSRRPAAAPVVLDKTGAPIVMDKLQRRQKVFKEDGTFRWGE